MTLAALDVFVDASNSSSNRRGLILEKTWSTSLLSAAALGVALAVALPIGVVLGHLHRGSFVAVNVANIGRALPSLVVIAVGIAFLGIGFTTCASRSSCSRSADPDERLRRRRRGRRGRRRGGPRDGDDRRPDARRVELPLALPLIFAGIRIAAVFVVATATIAAIAGGGGLGDDHREPGELPARGRGRRGSCVSLLALAVDAGARLGSACADTAGIEDIRLEALNRMSARSSNRAKPIEGGRSK